MNKPLPDMIRPSLLEDVVGQEHILGNNGLLKRLIQRGSIPNMIFYGPSGTGKTTVANIIASQTKRRLYKLNATSASIADIKAIIDSLDTLLSPNGVLIYLDEIQYFNKKQQQSLLEYIENGKITLISSTTENPYFYVFNAILSRCTLFEFKPPTAEEIKRAVLRAVRLVMEQEQTEISWDEGVIEHIAASCGGDVRKAVSAVELLMNAAPIGVGIHFSIKDAQTAAQRSAIRYDRDGDAHYDLLSAFQKSIRGSDPDASVYYLARLLAGGDLASVCRRLLVIAAEDVGLAYPQGISIVKSCVDAALQIGLPEAQLPLSQAVLLLATAPKSNSAAKAIGMAMADITAGRCGDIPAHLKDSHYKGAAKLGRGTGYLYPHDFPGHYVRQEYLPCELVGTKYYEYGDNKTERLCKSYWDSLKL